MLHTALNTIAKEVPAACEPAVRYRLLVISYEVVPHQGNLAKSICCTSYIGAHFVWVHHEGLAAAGPLDNVLCGTATYFQHSVMGLGCQNALYLLFGVPRGP